MEPLLNDLLWIPHRDDSLPRDDMFVRAPTSLLIVPFAASGVRCNVLMLSLLTRAAR